MQAPTVQFATWRRRRPNSWRCIFGNLGGSGIVLLCKRTERSLAISPPREVNMRRPHTAVLLALIGIALAPSLAAAPRRQRSALKKRALTNCPAFHQSRIGNEGLRFDLQNNCGVPVVCSLSWSVHCRGSAESPGERSSSLELAIGTTDGVVASGSACGPDGWDIDGIHWSCQPQPAGRTDTAGAKEGDL
jgi:hypothetical protein